jgi:4-diphosphocytidyl-2-C-methyl-D-erythritol kinase
VTLLSLTLPAFAKINWYFSILGKRPDSYHEIRTVLQTISLHDRLTFRVREEDQILFACNDLTIPTDESNLVVKAANLLRSAIGSTVGIEIELQKKIPAQAGLGGGSSNAAITLLGLNELWETNLSLEELSDLAAKLGADVPFFLFGGRVLGEGIGTQLSPLEDIEKSFLIVITPNATVSTPVAYASVNAPSLTTPNPISILSSSFAERVFEDSLQTTLHNDFERVIFEIEPEIYRVKEALVDTGARGALLAGSGSSVFGVFQDIDARERALGELKSEAGWRVASCETISREEYFQAMGLSGSRFLRSLNLHTDTGA